MSFFLPSVSIGTLAKEKHLPDNPGGQKIKKNKSMQLIIGSYKRLEAETFDDPAN